VYTREWRLHAAPNSDGSTAASCSAISQFFGTGRCSKHQSWFIIFFEQQEDATWLAVGAVPVSDHVVNSTVSGQAEFHPPPQTF
jgi:hypothetical protein